MRINLQSRVNQILFYLEYIKEYLNILQCCAWLTRELPVPAKKWYKSIDDEFLEKSRKALEEYLQVHLFAVFCLNS